MNLKRIAQFIKTPHRIVFILFLWILWIAISISCRLPVGDILYQSIYSLSQSTITAQKNTLTPIPKTNQYIPSAEILDLAELSGMTVKAREIFYSTHPVVHSDRQKFEQDCRTEISRNQVELGCYTSENRIFLLKIDDSRLKSEMAVVAAHEMLHAAYARLSAADRTMINSFLNDVLPGIQNPDLVQRIKMYQTLEPGQKDNELHSILGTEYSPLGIDLEQYYSLYFSDDRQAVMNASNLFNQVYTQKEAELGELQNQIKKMRSEMKQHLAAHNPAAYNQLVPQVNSLIEKYNLTVKEYNSLSRQLMGEEIPVESQ